MANISERNIVSAANSSLWKSEESAPSPTTKPGAAALSPPVTGAQSRTGVYKRWHFDKMEAKEGDLRMECRETQLKCRQHTITNPSGFHDIIQYFSWFCIKHCKHMKTSNTLTRKQIARPKIIGE